MSRFVASLVVIVAGVDAAKAQPEPAVDWSGFYLGGSLGAVHGESDPRTGVASSGGYFTTTDPAQIEEAGAGSLSQFRPTGSLYGGYGMQFGNIVAGLEVSAGTLFIDQSRAVTTEYQSLPGTSFTIEQTVSADWVATFRPRVGWAQDGWLAYVSGGVAVTQLNFDSRFSDNAFSASSDGSTDELKIGWTVGGGGEFALDEDWSLRGEYMFTDFGDIDSSSVVDETFVGNVPAALDHSADFTTHAFSIGVTFRF
jgi:opacity protein-like surface antigen